MNRQQEWEREWKLSPWLTPAGTTTAMQIEELSKPKADASHKASHDDAQPLPDTKDATSEECVPGKELGDKNDGDSHALIKEDESTEKRLISHHR